MRRLIFPFAGLSVTITLYAFSFPVMQSRTENIKIMNVMQDSVKILMEKTKFQEMNILYITDTAETTEKIKEVMDKGYRELMPFIQKNNIQAQKFMAWYYTMQPPWTVAVAIKTDKIPRTLSGRIESRVQKGGEVIIAHMWGPYSQLGQAYSKIQTWLKENGRKANGIPFEIYVNDPSSAKNPSDIQTDVYQPIE